MIAVAVTCECSVRRLSVIEFQLGNQVELNSTQLKLKEKQLHVKHVGPKFNTN